MNDSLLVGEKKIFGWGKYELSMIVWFFFMWGIVFLDRMVMPYLAPVIMEDLSLTDPQYGLINMFTTGCYALSAIFLTSVLESTGKRKIWLVLLCLGTGIFATLGAVTNSFVPFLITRALVGFCEGPLFAILLGMVYKESSPKKVAINTGIIASGAATLALAVGPIIATQIAAVSSWRMSFIVTGLVSVFIGLALIKVLREVPFIPEEKKESAFSIFKKILKVKNVVICFCMAIAVLCGFWSLSLYATLFFTVNGGHDLSTAGFIVGLMGVMAIVWNIVVPKLSDITGRKPALILWCCIMAVMPYLMFGVPQSIAAVIFYAIVGGMPGAVMQYLQAIIPNESLPNYMFGIASGLIVGVGEIIGGAIWPAIAGFVAEDHGYPTIIFCAGIALTICAILSLFLKETRGQVVESL